MPKLPNQPVRFVTSPRNRKSTVDGQREIHAGGAVGCYRGRHVEQSERNFVPQLAVESIEDAGGAA